MVVRVADRKLSVLHRLSALAHHRHRHHLAVVHRQLVQPQL